MDAVYETSEEKECVILVAVELNNTGKRTKNQISTSVDNSLDELQELAQTAGARTVGRLVQNREAAHPGTYIGKGKISELRDMVSALHADAIICDDELSPAQLTNLQEELSCKVIDRTVLILDIFAAHASTSEGKLQVELAQLQYLLPRLTGLWTHLSKQRGGVGMRGPGEKEIETDRRVIRNKISLLKERLAEIDKQKATQRKHREQLVRVALVGYTNVGKSSLMNLLSKSNVLAENKLFATLDTTVRKVVIRNLPFLLSDTVGFIRKLPHHLVESFKSTLDEVRESDILLHVVDISHPNFEEQIEVVNKTLADVCESAEKPMIMVFNKIDAFTYTPKDPDDLTPVRRENIPLEDFRSTWMSRMDNNCVFISAKERINIEELKELLYQKAKEIHTARFPYNDFLYQKYDDISET